MSTTMLQKCALKTLVLKTLYILYPNCQIMFLLLYIHTFAIPINLPLILEILIIVAQTSWYKSIKLFLRTSSMEDPKFHYKYKLSLQIWQLTRYHNRYTAYGTQIYWKQITWYF